MAAKKKDNPIWKEIVKVVKGPYRVTTGAVAAAILAGLVKLLDVTKTFPQPSDTIANVIIFIAVLLVVADAGVGVEASALPTTHVAFPPGAAHRVHDGQPRQSGRGRQALRRELIVAAAQ